MLFRSKQVNIKARLHEIYSVELYSCNFVGNFPFVLILNALKELAGIDHSKHVISPEALRPIQTLKTEYLGSKNPRLHSDETLIALSISAADNEDAKLALQQIPNLKGCQVHTSVLLSQVDILEFRKLGVELTCEPKSEHAKKLQK